MKKLLAMLLAMAMLVGVLAGCTGGEDTQPSGDTQASTEGTQASTEGTTEPALEDPQYGGHAHIVTQSKPNIDPSKAGTWHYIWNTAVYEPILTRDLEGNIQPSVCDFEVSEDMLTLKLTVRENKVFHNGDPVDIEDVHASLARNTSGVHGNSTKFVGTYIESMTVEGDTLTIQFTEYNEKTWFYLASWQTYNVVIPKEVCDKLGQEKITTVEDAIGTGPYRVTDYAAEDYITIEKWADYVVDENGLSGMAGPKYGYLDSMTFTYNGEASSASIGLMAGDYDVAASFEEEYYEEAAGAGIVHTNTESTLGLCIVFNAAGTGPCAKYPDLRKAIMAAIDYTEFLDMIQGADGYVLNGNPIVGAPYATEIFDNCDYFGAQNLEVAAKYVEAAKAAGWDPETEKVQLVVNSGLTDQQVLFSDYMDAAGIPYDVVMQEAGTWAEFTAEPSNAWDFKFRWPTLGDTPLNLGAEFMNTFDPSEEKASLIAEMNTQIAGSADYLANWEELSQVMADGCAAPFMGQMNWTWSHDGDFVVNDDGLHQFFYNSYWNNPEEHTAG